MSKPSVRPDSQRVWLAAFSALALVSVATGCEFRPEVPSNLTIECTVDGGACPSGYVCRASLNRCVASGASEQAAATVVGIDLQPALGNALTTFELTFQVTAALAHPPTAVASSTAASRSYPFDCAPCTSALACTCTFTPDPQDLPPAGALQVSISLVDVNGNAPPSTAGPSFQLDFTPPVLVPPVTLALSPPSGVDTPLEAVGPGVGIELCFTVDKALAAAPSVWAESAAQPDAGQLAFTLAENHPRGAFFFYCYQATLSASTPFPDGPLQAWAQATDVAGNTTLLPLTPIAVDGGPALFADRTPPSPPDLSDDAGLRYHRAPWGELPTVNRPTFYLSSPGAAVSKAGTLIAYADQTQEQELGRWAVAPGPVPELDLVPVDHAAVWVELVDRAGNAQAGGPVQVKSVDWVMSLGTEGELATNPHTCFAKSVFGSSLFQADDAYTALGPGQGVTGLDGGTVHIAGAANWRLRNPGVPDLSNNTYSYDAAHGLLYIFNGDDLTATFDGHNWSQPPEHNEPSERTAFGLTHDRARGREVLFGGEDETSTDAILCDTWELSADGWEQVRACEPLADGGLDPTLPPPRTGPCLSYDPVVQQTVLVGGAAVDLSSLADVWTWNGATWSALAVNDGGPDFSCELNTLAYLEGDAGHFVMLESPVTSGDNGPITWRGDWDGQSYRWSPALSALPGSLSVQSLTQDPASGLLVAAFIDGDQNDAVELWTWDGSSPAGWQPLGTIPTPWDDQDLIMLAPLPGAAVPSVVVMDSGGQNDADNTYVCTLQPLACNLLHTGGTQIGDEPAFPYSDVNAVAMDPNGYGVLAGDTPATGDGGYLGASAFMQDSMGNESEDWGQGGLGPAARDGATLTYDPASGTFWLLGGNFYNYSGDSSVDDLWSYSIGTSTWTELSATVDLLGDGGMLPAREGGDTLLYLPDAGFPNGMVAMGSGQPPLLLVESDAGLEVEVLGSTTPAGSVALDPTRHRLVLVALYGEMLYESTPPALDLQPVLHAPHVPLAASVIFEPSSQSLLLIGGGSSAGEATEGQVNRWDGTSLTLIPLADPENDGNPTTHYLPAVAYDAFREKTILVGPTGDDSVDQTWELGLAENRPGLLCQFHIDAAEAPPGAVFQRLEIDAQAGTQALGTDGGPATLLSVWNSGAWRPVQTCVPPACSSAESGALTYETESAPEIHSLFSDLETLGVALTPSAPNGQGQSQVTVDSVQVRLSYRLP